MLGEVRREHYVGERTGKLRDHVSLPIDEESFGRRRDAEIVITSTNNGPDRIWVLDFRLVRLGGAVGVLEVCAQELDASRMAIGRRVKDGRFLWACRCASSSTSSRPSRSGRRDKEESQIHTRATTSAQ